MSYRINPVLAMGRNLRFASEGRYSTAAQNLIDLSHQSDSGSAMSSQSFKRMIEEEEKEILATTFDLKKQQTEQHRERTYDDGIEVRSLSIYSRQGRSTNSITRETADDSSTNSVTQQQLIIRPGWMDGVPLVGGDDDDDEAELADSVYSSSDS